MNPQSDSLTITLVISCIFFSCSGEKHQLSTELLSTAVEAERFIQQSKLTGPNYQTWSTMPDSAVGSDPFLYQGTPGIILYYLELFHATQDTSYLQEGMAGADFLMQAIPDTIPDQYHVGLYTGIAGIGYTLMEVYQSTGQDKYKDAVFRVIDLLGTSATNSASGIQWGQITDIVFGSAGIWLQSRPPF